LYATACVNPSWLRRAESGWAFVRPSRVEGQKQYGLIAAIDSRTDKIVWQKRLQYAGCYGGSGATATAGGLVFHVEPDGNFQTYDAKTGDLLAQFQTGEVAPGGSGSVVTYESREQYLAFAINRHVWTLQLGGTVPARPAAPAPPTVIEWEGRIDDSATVQLGTVSTFNINTAGRREEWSNDYGLNPNRARTKVGTTVTFMNRTNIQHAISARDGSWSTGTIKPGESGSVTITKPGTYEYVCQEHPWSIGQLIVD